jgi:phospholipid/cholesterol/gamma-HCH transport system permease protein
LENGDCCRIEIGESVSGLADLAWYHDAVQHLRKREKVELDFRKNREFSSLQVVHLMRLMELSEKRETELKITRLPGNIKEEINNFIENSEREFEYPERHSNVFEYIGERAYELWDSILSFILLSADALYFSIRGLFQRRDRPAGSIGGQIINIGINAFPIVVLLVFLVGIVVALQSAVQLRRFGANIYVVDLIVISMAREMAPLITAILIAGRSGASIAAEIATMKVGEELDALKTMGLNPFAYVVVPKIYAILIALPLLTLFADLIGILGGMVVAGVDLDIGPVTFFIRAFEIAEFWDFLTGLIRSLVFAWQIIIIASWFGLNASGGAEGVGKATTSAVVVSIFMIIVADSMLGLLFYL